MTLRSALEAFFAASLFVTIVATVEDTVPKASVRGGSDTTGAEEKMAKLNSAMRELRELWEDNDRGWDQWDHEGESDGWYDDDYHRLIDHFIYIGKHIKSMFSGHRHQLANGLEDFKHQLLEVANETIEDHDATHNHKASSKETGNHTHTAGGTTNDNGNHKHSIPPVMDHIHGLPDLKCETSCYYVDEYNATTRETEPAGGHNHTGMTEHAGEHNHTFAAEVDYAGEHDHEIHVEDKEITLNHTTGLFEELHEAADILWELIRDIRNKTKFPHKHKFNGDKHWDEAEGNHWSVGSGWHEHDEGESHWGDRK